jgi:ubiquinone/menaquinone biosynthesis C-methylase UbiE
MRLNLGCGKDIKPGYVNIDWYDADVVKNPDVKVMNLQNFPWLFEDNSAEEVLMLDFLEHFAYTATDKFLQEVWRVLKIDGFVDIQVPDLDECAAAATQSVDSSFFCNACGFVLVAPADKCAKCKQTSIDIAKAAVARLYGGQNHPGNYHYTAFSKRILQHYLEKNGFHRFTFFEYNENGETYAQNWNFKVRAYKKGDLW